MQSRLDVDIPRDPQAPRLARRAVESLGPAVAPDVKADVVLLVSELITNSVKYAGDGDIALALRSDEPGHLLVQVADGGGGFVPTARDRPAIEVGGWGLHLVQTLSDRWGVRDGGTQVWFEITPAADRGSAIAA